MVKTLVILGESDRERVERSIADAELRTGAEFVVVVARRSGRYDRSEDIFGVVSGMLLLLGATLLWPSAQASNSWDATLRPSFGLPLTLLILAAGFILGVALASHFPMLSRPFRTRHEMESKVRRRAADCFADFRLRDAGGTGVLIYVSLAERIAWVTADDAVGQKADEPVWGRVRDRVIHGITRGSLADGLCDALLEASASLAAPFPPSPKPANRLPNVVREIA